MENLELDKDNPKINQFHLRNRSPEAALGHNRLSLFQVLFYLYNLPHFLYGKYKEGTHFATNSRNRKYFGSKKTYEGLSRVKVKYNFTRMS